MVPSSIRANVESSPPTAAVARPAPAELADSRTLLQGLYLDLTAQVEEATAAALTAAMFVAQSVGDEADAGSRPAAREHELTVLGGIRERLVQVKHAVEQGGCRHLRPVRTVRSGYPS